MSRLLANQGLYELWKFTHFVTSSVTKRRVVRFLPVRSAGHHRPHVPTRHLNTGFPVWKDALQPTQDKPEDIQTLDLDKWKSVMRAQAASEEKQQVNDEEEASDDDDDGDDDDDESLKAPVGDLKDISSLEATRDLVAMWRLAGRSVPEEMTDEQLQALAELTTKSSRKKYLKFLSIKEGHRMARKRKQQQKKAEREASMEQKGGQGSDAEEERGPELKNTLVGQLWSRTMDKHFAWNCAQAMQFGQPLVFDMSYESNMTRQELKNAVSQLLEVEGFNRRATEPFHLHFCNLQADGAFQKELIQRYGEESWDRLFITGSDKRHVDLFPREQLVYLTADSPNVLRIFDHSKVYIIGALVDKSIQSGLSLANAKRLNLATARLPLDEYLHWEMGGKNLTLDQMMRIMLTIKETGKWEEALKSVPQRKYDGFHKQIQNTITNKRVTNHGQRQNGNMPIKSGETNSDWTFKTEGQRLYRSHNEPGFSGRDRVAGLPSDRENKPAAARVRTSFKSNMERRKDPGKGKMWWDKE